MIQLLMKRLECRFYFPKVDEPPGPLVAFALADQLNPKTVAMKSTALVPRRRLWQTMRRLETKGLYKPHAVSGDIRIALGIIG